VRHRNNHRVAFVQDEACSSIRVQLDSMPEEMDAMQRQITRLQVEEQALKKEKTKDTLLSARLDAVQEQLSALQDRLKPLRLRYNAEHARMLEIRRLQTKREKLLQDLEVAKQRGDLARNADLEHGAIPEVNMRLQAIIAQMPENPMLTENIGEAEIAAVVSRWTGIPVENLQKTEAAKLLSLKEELHKRVVGQDEAVAAVANAVIRSRAGLAASERGSSFLFLGPTGVFPWHHSVAFRYGNVVLPKKLMES
jgi:ATP-dependent Clp protease ATP-binding subunit ClpB